MKTILLHDVLAEGDYREFQENLVAKVLAEARRKRLQRNFMRFAIAASIVIGAFLIWQRPQPTVPATSRSVATKSITPTIYTVPLAAEKILLTRPTNIAIVTSAGAADIEIATDSARRLHLISDSELLNLFPERPTGLVAVSQTAKRFLFLDPADAKAFMSSN